jgi:hypothetical protein
MGIDFSALLECPRFSGIDDRRIIDLERGSPKEVREVESLWRAYLYFSYDDAEGGWVTSEVFPEPIPRPSTLSLSVSYRTGEFFYLTFGTDAVAIYHPLRLREFLTDVQWTQAMVGACRALARVMNATDGLITRDESPVIRSFRDGASYAKALQAATGQWGEVPSCNALYEKIDDQGTWDSHGYWRFLRDGVFVDAT